MPLFRRSKSPFAHEIDRFHSPDPKESWRRASRPKSDEPPLVKSKPGWFARVKQQSGDAAKSVLSLPGSTGLRGGVSLPGSTPLLNNGDAVLPKQREPHREKRADQPPSKGEPATFAGNRREQQGHRQTIALVQRTEQKQTRWIASSKSRGSSEAAKEGTRTSDLTIAALGVALGFVCALFPWYIFLNQDKFGAPALQFEGGEIKGRLTIGPQPQRIGAPMNVESVPVIELDLFATGTLPKEGGDRIPPPGLDEQPFPAEIAEFKLVHVANGRAMIKDDAGLWIVQRGSTLPDSSRVEHIEHRGGNWVLVTSNGRIVELTP